MNRFLTLIIGISLIFSTLLPVSCAHADMINEEGGRHIFYVGKFSQSCSIDELTNHLAQASIQTKMMFKNNCVSWTQEVSGGSIGVFATKDLFWVDMVLSATEGTEPFLNEFLLALAQKYELPTPQNCQLTDSVSITITNPDGTIDMAGMQVSSSPESEYYQPVLKQDVMQQYHVSENNVAMKIEDAQLCWLVRSNDGVKRVQAITYHEQS